jgi:hypothetical protein
MMIIQTTFRIFLQKNKLPCKIKDLSGLPEEIIVNGNDWDAYCKWATVFYSQGSEGKVQMSSFLFCTGVWTQDLWFLGKCSTAWTTPPALFCVGYFWDRVSQNICLGWLWSMTLLTSASQVVRTTCVSHWCQAPYVLWCTAPHQHLPIGLCQR